MNMTRDQKIKIVERINAYADKVLSDIDPQKTPISTQLEALRPEMEKIAEETHKSLSDIFIIYMDLNSELSAEQEIHLQKEMEDGEADDSMLDKEF